MGKRAVTLERQDIALEVLSKHRPMTVRQVYYQFVSRHAIDNTRSMYQRISDLLVDMRKDGLIPWDWIEDRIRRPRQVAMWDDLKSFGASALQSYRRDVWIEQPELVEVWLEKDALSGIFEDVLRPYRVTLNVGRGYDGWSSIHDAAMRYREWPRVHIAYFGDFDPSGEDMQRSLQERLTFFDVDPVVTRWAILPEDIATYDLPPEPAKKADKRRDSFVERFGDETVELDALPTDVLEARIRQAVESVMDLDALERVEQEEKRDKTQLAEALGMA